MRNNIKSERGFSLIELLIVIAIMGVLAVVALTSFTSVLQNSKKKADISTARNIQKQVSLMLTETGVTKPSSVNSGWTTVDNLLVGLQAQFTYDSDGDGTAENFGPYLEARFGSAVAKNYDPQWNAANGGTYSGWNIAINNATGLVTVTPQSGDTASGF